MRRLKFKGRVLKLAVAAAMCVGCLNLVSVYALPKNEELSGNLEDELSSKLEELKKTPVDDLVSSQYTATNTLWYDVNPGEHDRRSKDLLCIVQGEDKSDGGVLILEDGTSVDLGPNEADPSVYVDVFVAKEDSCFENLNSGDEVSVKVTNKKSGEKVGIFKAKLVDMDKSDFHNKLINDPSIEKAKNVEYVRGFRSQSIKKISSEYPRFMRVKIDNRDGKIEFTNPNKRRDKYHYYDCAYNFTFYVNYDDAKKSGSLIGRTMIEC